MNQVLPPPPLPSTLTAAPTPTKCPACKGKGYTDEEDDFGRLYASPCDCRPDLVQMDDAEWLEFCRDLADSQAADAWAQICRGGEAN